MARMFNEWEIKKGTNLEFKVEGKLDTYHAQVYATESSIDMETHSLNIRAIYPLSLIHIYTKVPLYGPFIML